MKKIAVGDLGEFWYGDYKEPFEELEGGIPGYPRGALLVEDAGDRPGDRLLCAFCGAVKHNLGNHARLRHGLHAADYKREVGLLQKSALVSESLRQKMVARSLRLVASGVTGLKPGNTTHQLRRFSRGGTPKLTAEQLNKTGRCREQVKAVAAQLAREGRLTYRSLRAVGIYQGTVDRYFGPISELRRLLGTDPRPRRVLSDDELIASLRQLATVLGRTPAASDLRRHGMPSTPTYIKRFGSFVNACRKAGLQPNLPTPSGPDRDVAFLVAYATLGNIHKACRVVGMAYPTAASILSTHGFPFGSYEQRYSNDRKEWASEMARRLAGWPDVPAAAHA